MTLEPFGPDNSALDTSATQCSTWSSTMLAATTDTSGTACGSSASTDANVGSTPPADAYGYQEVSPEAVRRPLAAPPAVFTAATVAALRELLEHGYDPAELAAVIRDHGGEWQVEHIDPGSAWIAVCRGGDGVMRVIAANDLGSLGRALKRST